jgi:molecular chaperone GrpE
VSRVKGNGGDGEIDDDVAADVPDPGGAEERGLEPVPTSPEREVEALQRERDELKDALLRRRADFENYKRRVERDQQVSARDAAADIFRRLVDTVDNLERALVVRGGEDALREGVELTLRELRTMLDGQGVVAVDPQGERFDPLRHQALLHEPVEGFAEGTVAEVFRKGYTFKERLLRPALVKVSSGESRAAGDGGEAEGGDDIQ